MGPKMYLISDSKIKIQIFICKQKNMCKKLFTETDYDSIKSYEKLPFECISCGKIFYVEKKYYSAYLKNKSRRTFEYCSKGCADKNKITKHSAYCEQCGKLIMKYNYEIKNTKKGKIFCSRSCSASYNNVHKTKGVRRSKLELFLETELTLKYPNLYVLYNNKEIINSELDIYIPSLNLAFELNGIFHYEPIFGLNKLNKMKNNDARKFQACLEQNIELCIIDSSNQKYFKKETSLKYLTIITSIIEEKLSPRSDSN